MPTFFQVQETPRAPQPVGHEAWAGRVLVPERYLARSARIEDTAERAITADQLNDLANQIENGVEFGDEDVDVSEFRNGLTSFVKNDQTLVRYLDDPFSCDYVEEVVAEFFKMSGLKARNYQVDILKFIMNVATEADIRVLLC